MPTRPPVLRISPRRRPKPGDSKAKGVRNRRSYQRAMTRQRVRHPSCCDPFVVHGERERPATEVHHVEMVADRPELALDPRNLRSICAQCHGRVTVMEMAGEDVRHLFKV